MASEPKIPIGIDFFGFFVSCAAVLTASKPIKDEARGALTSYIGRDFGWQKSPETPNQWGFWAKEGDHVMRRHGLPLPALRGGYQLGNAAAALAALHAVNDRLPVSQGAVKQGLLDVNWPGRFQVLPGRPVTVLDVGHNAHAAIALERALADMAYFQIGRAHV